MPKTDKEKKAEVFTILCNHKKVSVEGVKSITNFEDKFIEKCLNAFVEEGVSHKGKYAKFWRINKMYTQVKLFE